MGKIILNLGCGKTRIPNTIGVDSAAIEGYVDVVHDLNVTPYPFSDGYADEIHFYDVLEHLEHPVRKLEELYRILKPNGIIFMRVPHFSSMGAFTDLTHVRPFGYTTFDCLDPNHYHHFYTSARFKILKKEIKYFGLYPNKGIYEKYIHSNECFWLVKPVVRAVNFLIRMSPIAFERFWCYWVGGAMEIDLILQKQVND